MRKKWIISIISITLLTFVYLFNFTSLEFGNYDSLQEGVYKGIIYKDKTILDIEQINDVAIVLYQTIAEINSRERAVISVAFFNGNEKKGWKKNGTDSWEWNLESNFSAYQKMYFNNKTSFEVHYGEVINNDIHSIQLKNQSNNTFVEAKLITVDNQRFYIGIGDFSDILTLDDKGNLIEQKRV